jgi:sugar phosphate isomerase/epimerase
LSWGSKPIIEVASSLKEAGMEGIEIAPTYVWPEPEKMSLKEVKKTADLLLDFGLSVSGTQSLLFGHPEFQLFDRQIWPEMKRHLEVMFELTSALGSKVAVFGSPKNRIKGQLNPILADDIAAEFLASLIPSLERNEVVLTLEPNAPQYGADYLINYGDVCNLSKKIRSDYIAPQIDTGCLWMIGEQPISALKSVMPHHIHLSTPNLGKVPGESNFSEFLHLAEELKYEGWMVIETLNAERENPAVIASWLTNHPGRE